jgi:Skp family chaperone for outer membrane proteins
LPSAPATQQNAAVITFNAAVLNTNEAQNEFADLQKKFVPREAHLKALSDEVDG